MEQVDFFFHSKRLLIISVLSHSPSAETCMHRRTMAQISVKTVKIQYLLKDVGYTGKQVHANFLVKEGILVPKIN